MVNDSIRIKGLKAHINEYCIQNNIGFSYDDFVRWLEEGEYGEPVKKEWIRRRFQISRPTFHKWLVIHEEEKTNGN